MTHYLVLEHEVAFDLRWLTASVYTCSASWSYSISFVVHDGLCLIIFFDLRCSAPGTKAFFAQSPF